MKEAIETHTMDVTGGSNGGGFTMLDVPKADFSGAYLVMAVLLGIAVGCVLALLPSHHTTSL